MGYSLGIDVGTTFTAAAVCRDGQSHMVTLGLRTPEMPSVVAFDEHGTVYVGEPAARLAMTRPNLVAREYKRRIGDPVPMMVAGEPRTASELTKIVLDHVIEVVSTVEGEPPSSVTVAYPASWGPYKQEIYDQILRTLPVDKATRITEPLAAAHHFASEGLVARDATIAVFDFGGGTFDAAVLAPGDDGQLATLGETRGIERLGGVDLDHAVFDHVVSTLDIDLSDFVDDPGGRAAIGRLRTDTTDAKEALSDEEETAVMVMLPGVHRRVDLSRTQFDEMIGPNIDEAIGAVEAAIETAGVDPDDLDGILLVGGSSRIPLVSQMVSEHFDRPILKDTNPKHGVALGAARFDAEEGDFLGGPPVALLESADDAEADEEEDRADGLPVESEADVESRSEVARDVGEDADENADDSRRGVYLGVLVCLLVVLVGVGMTRLLGGEAEPDEARETNSGADSDVDADAVAPALPGTDGSGEGSNLGPADSEDPIWPLTDVAHRPDIGRFEDEGPGSTLQLLWEIEYSERHPVLVNDGLMFRSQGDVGDGAIIARDLTTGEEIWSTPREFVGELELTQNRLIMADLGRFEAFDQATGRHLGWLAEDLDLQTLDAPVVRGDRFVSVRTDFSDEPWRVVVQGLDATTSEVAWTYETPFDANLSFARLFADDDTVIVAEGSDGAIGLDIHTGEELWSEPSINALDIRAMDNGVVVISRTPELAGIDARSGEVLWDERPWSTRLASNGELLFTSNSKGEIAATALRSGEVVWTVLPNNEPLESSLVIGGETLYALRGDGTMSVHDPATGEILESGELPDLPLLSGPPSNLWIDDAKLAMTHFGNFYVYAVDEDGGLDAAGADEPEPPAPDIPLVRVAGADSVVSANPSFIKGGYPFVEPGPAAEPDLLWTIDRTSNLTPAVAAGGLVFYADDRVGASGSTSLYLVAVDARTGVEVWSSRRAVITGVHVIDDVVLVDGFGGLRAFDLATGEDLITFPDLAVSPAGPLAVRDGALLAASRIRAASGMPYLIDSIDLTTGETNWTFSDATSNDAIGRVHFGETVGVLVNEDAMIAVDLEAGEELWRSTEFRSRDFEFIVGDLIYLSLNQTFRTVDARTGELMGARGNWPAATAHDAAMGYFSQRNSIAPRVSALRHVDGAEAWNVSTPIDDGASMVLVGPDRVYFVDDTLGVAAHRRSDGGLSWYRPGDTDRPLGGRSGAVGSDVIVISEGGQIRVYG